MLARTPTGLEAATHAAPLTVTCWTAPVGLCLLDADLRFVVVNADFASLGGSTPAEHVGKAMAETTPNLARFIEPKCRDTLSGGEPMPAFEIEGRLPGSLDTRWWICRCQPVVESDGRVHGVTCALVDITERKRIEHAQLQMIRELDHRSRNLLDVILSVIRVTAADAPADVDALVELLEGRIAAVARVHTLLSVAQWRGANLADIVKGETAVAQARVRGGGPAVRLIASAAQALAMVLHEFVTNAAKYGALSQPGGVISIDWKASEDGVELGWSERGGPTLTAPPARRSFGTELIDLSVAGPLAGTIERRWEPDGLCCLIRIGPAVLLDCGRPARRGKEAKTMRGAPLVAEKDGSDGVRSMETARLSHAEP